MSPPLHGLRFPLCTHPSPFTRPPRLQVCEVTYARVQGRDSLVQHFRASKFPSDDATELMPLVFSTATGRATNPLPIHAYLAEVEGEGGEEGAASSAAEAEAEERS